MKLLYIPEKLPNLIRFGLTAAALQVERARGIGMFINVMAAPNSIQTVTKRFDDLAKVRKTDVVHADQ